MSLTNSQQQVLSSPSLSHPHFTNLDTPSQTFHLQPENFQFVDHFSALFDLLAHHIDKKFSDIQDFLHMYNKSVQLSNKNFHTVAQVVFFKNPLDNLPLYKNKRQDKRLSDEVSLLLKKINDCKEELLKGTHQQSKNQISLESLKDSNFNYNLMQSQNMPLKTSQCNSARSNKISPPSSRKITNIVTIEHEEAEEEAQDIVRSLKKSTRVEERRRNRSIKEESEVQDDSDNELKKKNVIGNSQGFTSQRSHKSSVQSQKGKFLRTGTSSEGDTEGEIINIGEETGMEQAKLINKKLVKTKTSRSPLRSAKNQMQNKHATKKSPNISKYDQLSKELQLDHHSSVEVQMSQTNPKFVNPLNSKNGENLPKSPFAYIQKASMSKYNISQSKPTSVAQSFNSSQNLQKHLNRSKAQSKGKVARNRSTNKSKSPSRNIGSNIQTPSGNSQPKAQQSQAHFLTQKLQESNLKLLNQFSTLQTSKGSSLRESKVIEKQDPVLQSSSGGSSTKLFESLQVNQPANVSQSQQFATPNLLRPQPNTEQQEQKVPAQSPMVTAGEDKEEEKEVKQFEVEKKVEEEKINDSEVEKHFEENIKRIESGVTGETVDGHRFTLQGESQQLNSSKMSSQRNSQHRYMQQHKITSVKDIIPGETHAFDYTPQINSEAQIQILTQDNLFSPSGQQQIIDFDVAQYNSPSFAFGQHLHQSIRYTSSSSGRDIDSSYCLQLNYDQKIILDNQVEKRANRTGFLKLPGEALCMIGEYLNEKLPIFIFTNRISFKVCLQFQIEFYEQQRQMMYNQMVILSKELDRMQNAKKFDLSTQSRDEYESIEGSYWKNLIEIMKKQSEPNSQLIYLKSKDIIILRLYLTFMGLDLAEEVEDRRFMNSAAEFLEDCGDSISELMDPERSFLISEDNKQKIKELLVNLQREKLLEEEGKNEILSKEGSQGQKIIEIFTNLLFEALQFVNIIPNVLVSDMKQEIEELKKVGEAFNGIKNNLIDFKNLVA